VKFVSKQAAVFEIFEHKGQMDERKGIIVLSI
jgi:hypothetical protein